MKKYNVKVFAPKAEGVCPRANVITEYKETEYKDMSYDDAMKIKEIWLNTEINVVIKESEK